MAIMSIQARVAGISNHRQKRSSIFEGLVSIGGITLAIVYLLFQIGCPNKDTPILYL